MRLSVLGSCCAWPQAGMACSGYLVRGDGDGGASVLLDAGSGVFSRLRAAMAPEELSAVAISHLHPDHFMDLMPLAYYLQHSARTARPGARERVRLLLPPGGIAHLGQLVELFGHLDGEAFWTETFACTEYEPDSGRELAVGGLSLAFAWVPHYIDSHAIRVDGDGRRLVFSADCGPGTTLPASHRDADVALWEAAFLLDEDSQPSGGHCTPVDAGRLAAAHGVRRLLLTHVNVDGAGGLDRALAAAVEAFGSAGPVEHAREGSEIAV